MLRTVSKVLIPIVSVVALCATTAVAEKQRPSQITPTGAEDSVRPSVADEDGTRNLDALTNDSTGGLTVVEHPDGSMSVDLQAASST